jgi:hypothetical protein
MSAYAHYLMHRFTDFTEDQCILCHSIALHRDIPFSFSVSDSTYGQDGKDESGCQPLDTTKPPSEEL